MATIFNNFEEFKEEYLEEIKKHDFDELEMSLVKDMLEDLIVHNDMFETTGDLFKKCVENKDFEKNVKRIADLIREETAEGTDVLDYDLDCMSELYELFEPSSEDNLTEIGVLNELEELDIDYQELD